MTSFILVLVAATVARFIIGAIWYMPKGLFGRKWLTLQGAGPDFQPENKGGGWILWGLLVTLLSTFVLTLFVVNYGANWAQGIFVAFLLWIGFMLPLFFQRKLYNLKKDYSWGLFWIDASYELAGLIVGTLVILALI